jgi:Glycosyl transferase family group 2
VWRKKCIEEAGGWTFDTLTEDLDLSYRAQLKGWKFKYLEHVETPGELPVIMQAIKSQQYRWNKGGAETARKNIGAVMRSSFSFTNKIHAFFHLFNSSVFVGLLIAALLSIPVLTLVYDKPSFRWIFDVGMVLLTGFFSITFFYWVSTRRFERTHPRLTFLSLYPKFLIVFMGLSLHNAIAVLEGLAGRKTPFVRTPKFNVIKKKDAWKNDYSNVTINWLTLAEGLLCVYFAFGIALGISYATYGLIFFHLLLTLGFGSVVYFSVKPAVHG